MDKAHGSIGYDRSTKPAHAICSPGEHLAQARDADRVPGITAVLTHEFLARVDGVMSLGGDVSSLIASATIRWARSHSSFGYFLGAGTTPPPRGVKPSTKPGAVQNASPTSTPPCYRIYRPGRWPTSREAAGSTPGNHWSYSETPAPGKLSTPRPRRGRLQCAASWRVCRRRTRASPLRVWRRAGDGQGSSGGRPSGSHGPRYRAESTGLLMQYLQTLALTNYSVPEHATLWKGFAPMIRAEGGS